MSWSFKSFEESSSTSVAGEILNCFNGMTHNVASAAKVGITDHHGGDSYGVVFFNSELASTAPDCPSGAWKRYSQQFNWVSGYQSAYIAIVSVLNGDGDPKLTEAQARYAHFAMSDYQTGYCLMNLYYPGE